MERILAACLVQSDRWNEALWKLLFSPGLSLSSSDIVRPESRLRDFWSLLNSTLSNDRPSAVKKSKRWVGGATLLLAKTYNVSCPILRLHCHWPPPPTGTQLVLRTTPGSYWSAFLSVSEASAWARFGSTPTVSSDPRTLLQNKPTLHHFPTPFSVTISPKLAADIRLCTDLRAMWYRTQTTCAKSKWFSLGSCVRSLLKCSSLPLLAQFNHSWTFPDSSGSGKLLKNSFKSAAKSKGGVLAISSHAIGPWVSIFTLSSLKARADAHLRKIPWMCGPFWKSALSTALMAGGRVLFTTKRERETPKRRPLAFLKSFKVDLLKDSSCNLLYRL